MAIGNAARWYVVNTAPNREGDVRNRLEDQSFSVFLPECLTTVRHARREETRRSPFFPSYLFVSLDALHGRWRSINGTPGVLRILTMGDHPAPLPDIVIDKIRDMLDPALGAIDKRTKIKAKLLQQNDEVRVTSGPFIGFTGLITDANPRERINILLDILGGTARITIPRQLVDLVAGSPEGN